MNIQMKVLVFTCKFTVVTLKLTWQVRCLVDHRGLSELGASQAGDDQIWLHLQAGLWLLPLLKLQGSVLSASHVSVSRRRRNTVPLTLSEPGQSGLAALGELVTIINQWQRGLEACCAHWVYPLPPGPTCCTQNNHDASSLRCNIPPYPAPDWQWAGWCRYIPPEPNLSLAPPGRHNVARQCVAAKILAWLSGVIVTAPKFTGSEKN